MAKKKIAGTPNPQEQAAERTGAAPRRRKAGDTSAASAPRSSDTTAPSPPGVDPSFASGTAESTNEPVDLSALSAPMSSDQSSSNGPTYDEIAQAAYLRYLKRGGGDGRDFEDWLEAEQELKSR